jgi:hypothetical protein
MRQQENETKQGTKMKKLIVLLLLFPVIAFSQSISQTIFAVADTIGSITIPDTVEMRIGDGPCKILTSAINDTAYVTVDDKIAETTQVFMIARESYYTAGPLQFRIYATGTDTITSKVTPTLGFQGAFTLFIRPDTVGTNTLYGTSTLEGN